MDDRLKETLSAMMDDQADELAIRRLLSRAELPEVRQQWQRWQSMQSLMHDDRRAFATLDVSAAVQDALSEKNRNICCCCDSAGTAGAIPVSALVCGRCRFVCVAGGIRRRFPVGLLQPGSVGGTRFEC